MFEEVLHQKSHQLSVSIFVNALRRRVLPLKTSGLLRTRVSIGLNMLKDASAQLRSERAERALLLQVLNNTILENVHDFEWLG